MLQIKITPALCTLMWNSPKNIPYFVATTYLNLHAMPPEDFILYFLINQKYVKFSKGLRDYFSKNKQPKIIRRKSLIP